MPPSFRTLAVMLLAAVAFSLGAVAQPVPTTGDEIRLLQQAIHGLQELKRLEVTADQRLALSRIVTDYQHDREVLTAPADPEALVDALSVVRDALLSNEDPTDEMWQAVAAARGGEPGQDQALQALRQKAVADLAQVLTEEQRRGLALPPVNEMAENILRAFHQSTQLPADQRATMQAQIIAEVSRNLAQLTGGANVDALRTTLQQWTTRVAGLQPGAGGGAGEQLVAELTGELTPLLTPDPQRLQERVNGRLNEMLEQPFSATILEDSARAMGAQP